MARDLYPYGDPDEERPIAAHAACDPVRSIMLAEDESEDWECDDDFEDDSADWDDDLDDDEDFEDEDEDFDDEDTDDWDDDDEDE